MQAGDTPQFAFRAFSSTGACGAIRVQPRAPTRRRGQRVARGHGYAARVRVGVDLGRQKTGVSVDFPSVNLTFGCLHPRSGADTMSEPALNGRKEGAVAQRTLAP